MHDRDPLDSCRGLAFGLWLSVPAWALTVALVLLGLRAVAW